MKNINRMYPKFWFVLYNLHFLFFLCSFISLRIQIGESGPFTQLTQEELITLVVKQQAELSKKDARIVELEEYIDNLLVRVMEEQPAILLSLNSKC